MLVEAHCPEADDLFFRVGVEFGQTLELVLRYAGELRYFLQRVFADELFEFLEADQFGFAGIALGFAVFSGVAVAGCFLFQRVVRAQTEADVGFAFLEIDVAFDEFLIDLAALDDVVADVVEDGQIGVGDKNHPVIRQLEAAMLEG